MRKELIVISKNECVHCGTCTAACTTGALTLETDTWMLVYDESKCTHCGLCILACPLNIIKKVS